MMSHFFPSIRSMQLQEKMWHIIPCKFIALNNEASCASTYLQALTAWNAQNTPFQLEQNKLRDEERLLTVGITTNCRQTGDIQEKATGSTDQRDASIKSFNYQTIEPIQETEEHMAKWKAGETVAKALVLIYWRQAIGSWCSRTPTGSGFVCSPQHFDRKVLLSWCRECHFRVKFSTIYYRSCDRQSVGITHELHGW